MPQPPKRVLGSHEFVPPRRLWQRRTTQREALKRECPLYFNREIRENRESVYGLFFLVRAVRVVCGSCFSTGVSVVILTAKYAKIANKKGSVPNRLEELVERRMRHRGSTPGFFVVGKER